MMGKGKGIWESHRFSPVTIRVGGWGEGGGGGLLKVKLSLN